MKLFDIVSGNPWKENIALSCTPLWKYENEKPIANASGCLIKYRNKVFILSIAHATIAESEWNVEAEAIDNSTFPPTTIFQPLYMQSLSQFKFIEGEERFTEPEKVDFTYRRLNEDFESFDCIEDYSNNLYKAKRTIFPVNFEYKVSENLKYGFYGKIKFNGVKNGRILFQHKLESELRYIGEFNEFLKFKLPHKYGSHKNYIGCSGAPIIDENNNLVALVSHGIKSEDCIIGIDVKKYRAALDIEIE